MQLSKKFFARDPCIVAQSLLGKVLRRRYRNQWLAAQIIETEAYYLHEKGSHSSLGYTEKRKAMFMPAGTIYMYYARGGDSLNVSCGAKGDAVLIKAGYPFFDEQSPASTLCTMQKLNSARDGSLRPQHKLCAGQTLLCKALNLKVKEWDQQQFSAEQFYIDDTGYRPQHIIQTPRLGIPAGRDEHLMYRFIDHAHAAHCTRNPLKIKAWQAEQDYHILQFKGFY